MLTSRTPAPLTTWIRVATCVAAALLVMGAARGWFSWDYFSLWGLHPKWVWATGDFFTPGTELPLQFRYQSLFGSMQGWVLHAMGVNSYPDTLWGFVNASLALAAGFVIARRSQGFRSPLHALLLAMGLLMILPPEWGQITFGGYADLLGALGVAGAVLGGLNRDLALHAFGVALVFATRPVNAHWIVWTWLSLALSRSVPRSWLLRSAGVFALAWLMQKGIYRLARHQDLPISPLSLHFNNLDLKERLLLPWAILRANNGLAGVALITSFTVLRKRETFWAWFMGFGLFVMFWAYTFIFLKGVSVYPSIGRYTLPFCLPWLWALATRRSEAWNFVERLRPGLVLGIFALMALARGAEDARILHREGGLSAQTDYCRRHRAACDEGARLRALALASNQGGCDVYILKREFTGELDDLVTLYAALPTRLYFASSRVPKHVTACPLE